MVLVTVSIRYRRLNFQPTTLRMSQVRNFLQRVERNVAGYGTALWCMTPSTATITNSSSVGSEQPDRPLDDGHYLYVGSTARRSAPRRPSNDKADLHFSLGTILVSWNQILPRYRGDAWHPPYRAVR